MKFKKEDAVEKLNKALTNDGKKTLRLSKRTLESQTETLMSLIANDETELDDFVEKVLPMLASANSNAEHDQSEFIKEYQKLHPAPVPPKQDPPDADAATKALMDRIAAMEQKEQEREQAASLAAKKAEISKYLSDNNVKDSGWIEKILSVTSISFDEDVETKGKSLLEIYNLSHTSDEIITPVLPTAGGDPNGDVFAAVKAMRKSSSPKE